MPSMAGTNELPALFKREMSMEKQKKNVGKLCVLYFLSYIAFVLPYGYMQTFLEYVGYDVVERGIILSGTAVVAIAAQFVVGYLCDKYKTDKKFFNLSLVVFTISTLVMYQVTERSFFLHLIFISLVGGMCRTTMALQDTWTLETSETCRNSFGPIRAFGAIGWMIGSPIGAMIIEHYGYSALGYVFAGLAIVNIVCTMFMQDAVKVETSGGVHVSDLKELLLNKKYLVVVLIFLFINVIATADTYTTVDKMMALGAKEHMIGARWSIQAFTELPLFFAGAWLLKKFGDYKLMMFGTFMYILRFLGYAVVQSPQLIIAVTLMQCITYPLIMITSKTLVDDATPSHLRSSGQTIASAFYVGVSLLITPLIAGAMVDSLGVDLTLALIGISGCIPLGLGIVYKRLD